MMSGSAPIRAIRGYRQEQIKPRISRITRIRIPELMMSAIRAIRGYRQEQIKPRISRIMRMRIPRPNDVCLSVSSVVNLFSIFDRLDSGESVALSEVSAVPPASGAWLGVTSSGSTGLPKLVWRRWSALLSEVRTDPRFDSWKWAASFEPSSFAGVQAALHAWRNGGSIFWLGKNWETNWLLLKSENVHAISSTPTFLDLLLQFETGTQDHPWLPRQITLGGEVLRETAGKRFAARFASTRFTVIYAAAEHGVLLKTRRLDGWYESETLDRRYPSAWRVNDGALELLRDGTWISTGDSVETNGDLLRVIGRSDAVANVAGCKVSLDEVSRLAEQVPGVRRAVAVAEHNAVVGQVVALKFAIEPGDSPAEVQARIEDHLRAQLRKEAWPRRWEVDDVGVGRNSKRELR
jgi:acyl-CoA synthetase (AMP-forming)/AMP-acid ligase II